MMKTRALVIVATLALALSLVGVALVLAQAGTLLPSADHPPDSAAGPAVVGPAVTLTTTVGSDPSVCATTTVITTTSGANVTYCYEVTNTGTLTLALHDLDDSELGPILTGFPYSLAPLASAFMTTSTAIAQTTVNTATWTAYNAGPTDVVSATAAATVNVLPPLELTKTVGTDPNVCATTTAIDVPSGTTVTYCYEVTNTSAITYTLHDLADSELGAVLTGFPYSLAPSALAFITESAVITQTTVNTATWSAYNSGPTDVVSATAAATVNVIPPAIELKKTVGTNPNVCAAAKNIAVEAGTLVTYCYEVTNTGLITFTHHDLDDSELGSILADFPYDLAPAASAFITASIAITQTTINTATWTAYNPGPTDIVTATTTATVTVATIETAPEIDVAPAALAAELSPGEQLTRTVTISNSGNAALTWTVFFAPGNCLTPGGLTWVAADPPGGTTNPSASDEIVLTFTVAGMAVGDHEGVLCISSNDPDEPLLAVPLTMTISPAILYIPVIYKPSESPWE